MYNVYTMSIGSSIAIRVKLFSKNDTLFKVNKALAYLRHGYVTNFKAANVHRKETLQTCNKCMYSYI